MKHKALRKGQYWCQERNCPLLLPGYKYAKGGAIVIAGTNKVVSGAQKKKKAVTITKKKTKKVGKTTRKTPTRSTRKTATKPATKASKNGSKTLKKSKIVYEVRAAPAKSGDSTVFSNAISLKDFANDIKICVSKIFYDRNKAKNLTTNSKDCTISTLKRAREVAEVASRKEGTIMCVFQAGKVPYSEMTILSAIGKPVAMFIDGHKTKVDLSPIPYFEGKPYQVRRIKGRLTKNSAVSKPLLRTKSKSGLTNELSFKQAKEMVQRLFKIKKYSTHKYGIFPMRYYPPDNTLSLSDANGVKIYDVDGLVKKKDDTNKTKPKDKADKSVRIKLHQNSISAETAKAYLIKLPNEELKFWHPKRWIRFLPYTSKSKKRFLQVWWPDLQGEFKAERKSNKTYKVLGTFNGTVAEAIKVFKLEKL